MRTVYLDHQNATPVREEVLAAMLPFFRNVFGNPSSLHAKGLAARDAIETAREQVAGLIGARSPGEVVFTSNGTEAINLAVRGYCRAQRRRGNHIVYSRIEHRSVLRAIAALVDEGFDATAIEPDREGRIAPESVRRALRAETVLIAVHHANHEIGTIEPVSAIADLAQDRGVALFVDATASAGWLPIYAERWGVSLLALSAHRFGGPKGVGALYRRRNCPIEPLLLGGDQEGGLAPGTENVPAMVGTGVAALLVEREHSELATRTRKLQVHLLQGLRRAVPRIRLNGPEPGPERLPNNLHLTVDGVDGEGLALLLDTRGVAVASGPGCADRSVASHVLPSIGLSSDEARSTVMLSTGHDTTQAQITQATKIITSAVIQMRRLSPAWEDLIREMADGPPARIAARMPPPKAPRPSPGSRRRERP